MSKLQTLTALFVALSLSGGAWADGKPKLKQIGTIHVEGLREINSFRTSGAGDAGYGGLLQTGGTSRAKYVFSGHVTGLTAGMITHGYSDGHFYLKERGANDIFVQDDNYIIQWRDEAGYNYDINVEGITTYNTNSLLQAFATGIVPDEIIYWNSAGRFYTNNPALEYYDSKMVVLKVFNETINFQTGDISWEAKLYVLTDPKDTWETNPPLIND